MAFTLVFLFAIAVQVGFRCAFDSYVDCDFEFAFAFGVQFACDGDFEIEFALMSICIVIVGMRLLLF